LLELVFENVFFLKNTVFTIKYYCSDQFSVRFLSESLVGHVSSNFTQHNMDKLKMVRVILDGIMGTVISLPVSLGYLYCCGQVLSII